MLERIDVEEKNAKCNICAGELSVIEIILYGNRCIFCVEPALKVFRIGLKEYLTLCYYDYRIHYATPELIMRKGPDDARMFLLACVSELGFVNLGDVRTVKDKRRLLKLLR